MAPLQMVPGPVSVPPEVRAAYGKAYGSSDLEEAFFRDYAQCQRRLQELLATKNDVVVMMGEAMVALWGALKSIVASGDTVIAVSNGVFGQGLADMAKSLGAEVTVVDFDWARGIHTAKVCEVIGRVKPKLVTAIHCETPSGVLNPLEGLGEAVHAVGGLLCVDFVASAGGAPLAVDLLGIDLGLLGSQKCLSCAPDLGIVTVSPAAWKAVEQRGYQGYDALQPFKEAVAQQYMPYTFSWGSVAGLSVAVAMLLQGTVAEAVQRHTALAAHVRRQIEDMGLLLYTQSHFSPTVTAVCVPDSVEWPVLDKALRAAGVVFGGSWGPLAGKVFRIGHMGAQATQEHVDQALACLQHALKAIGWQAAC